ncbi:ssDNA binding protein [Rhizobium phage Pasto]|uniref:SsDNA binding protein n=1 Tax=Rhizobium phage Pasto TaxID=2767575 RepID=A0A7S6R8J3_9CAUD|nr:ssDNA binding protein [Rhizobium phage Pasto]
MAKKEVNPDQVRTFTPVGTLKFPKLTEPDHGTEAYPCSHAWGDYKTKLILDRADDGVDEFLSKLDDAVERAKELAEEEFAKLPVKKRKELEAKGGISPDLPYSVIYDEESEEDTGKVELNFKMRAGGERKKDGKEWTQRPDLFDAKGKPLPRDVKKGGKVIKKGVQIWGGSVAIINFDHSPYFMPGTGKYGITRRLNAVQVLQLVSGGGEGRSASSYGFGAQEGFSADDYQADNEDDEDVEVDGDDGDDDDMDAANF